MGAPEHRARFDILVTHARVVDGMGSPWYRASVGIRGGYIAAIGEIEAAEATTVLDAEDRWLAPGFIDAHVHTDLALLADPTIEPAIRQGVTSHVIGQDGISYAPVGAATAEIMHRYFAGVNGELPSARRPMSVAGFLDMFDEKVAGNVAYLVPHGCVRLEAMGPDDRRPTDEELAAMQQMVTQGIREGAVGVSTGLDYLPCRYAKTDELVALARAAASLGGVFVAHMRGYGPNVEMGMDEMCRIARESGAAAHVSHYNVPAELGLALIDDARSSGLDFTYDLYPYLAGSTTLMLWLPDDLHVGTVPDILRRLASDDGRGRVIGWFSGGAGHPLYPLSKVRFSHLVAPAHQEFLGLTPVDAARRADKPIGEFMYELLVAEELRAGVVAFDDDWRTEEELERLMTHPAHMAGSDGIYVGERPHPRGWGTFARYLARYVRDRGVLTLEDAVRRMTSFPARRFGMRDRGAIVPGMAADLVLFDLDRISDTSTYEHGRSLAKGVSHVLVNGIPVLWDGSLTGETPGRTVGRGGGRSVD